MAVHGELRTYETGANQLDRQEQSLSRIEQTAQHRTSVRPLRQLGAFQNPPIAVKPKCGLPTPLLSTSPGITVALIRVKMGSDHGDYEVSTTSSDFASRHVLECSLAFLISGEWFTIGGQAELATY